MKRIDFKRKESGAGAWGVGLDYLFKDHWGNLDKIVEDNYYGRHDKKLVNSLFPEVFSALKDTLSFMEKNDGWAKKAHAIEKFGFSAKTLNEKVVFIDTAVQFLRETYIGKTKIVKKAKEKKTNKKTKIGEIKGVVASSGGLKNIIGVARIILSDKDFPKVRKGDILITRETNASFLPAIVKAKAVVTDLGGILCHAAIVSRELKIPCIVGTKIVTQVLKNGDKIEINIKNGRVHKLAF